MSEIFVRSAYNYDRDAASNESALSDFEPTLTKQSFADECDINTIVKNFGLTGQLPDNIRPPTYADFEGIFDYHSAMNAIAQAGEAFDALPADIRARFHNDPGAFVEFCSKEENVQAMVDMGLAVERPADAVNVLNKALEKASTLFDKAASSASADDAAGKA